MKAILILGAVLLALGALLRLVRLGALAEYSAAGLRLKLKVGPLRLMLYPSAISGRNRFTSWAAGRWRW